MDYVLDTGALIALQRDRTRLLALVELAREERARLRVPAPALTEFLGHSPPSLRAAAAYVSARLEISSTAEAHARRAAALIQAALDARGRADPSAIDGLVAAEAELREAALVYDGDRADLAALAQASGAIELTALEELA